MSSEVQKYHEEDAIGKTYDFKVVRRLISYLRPYWKLVAAALTLTLLTNILVSLQPYFTKVAVDDFIVPKQTDGIWLFALAFFGDLEHARLQVAIGLRLRSSLGVADGGKKHQEPEKKGEWAESHRIQIKPPTPISLLCYNAFGQKPPEK